MITQEGTTLLINTFSLTLSTLVAVDLQLRPRRTTTTGIPPHRAAPAPRLILKFVLPHLNAMVDLAYTSAYDWSPEISEFRAVVPDAMDFSEWLKTQQKGWSNGTLFGEPAPPPPTHNKMLLHSGAVVALAVLRLSLLSRGSRNRDL